MLLHLVNTSTPLPHNLEKYLYICHLKSLKEKLKGSMDMSTIVAKQSIALLRYTDLIRPDVAFFEAGQAAKVIFDVLKIRMQEC